MSDHTSFLPTEVQHYLTQVAVHESPAAQALRLATDTLPGGHMHIASEQGQFLKLLIQLTGARQVLEIGTFTGYSALLMAEALPPGGELLTLEKSPQWQEMAKQYWSQAGVDHKITLQLGDAEKSCQALLEDTNNHGRFDFIFIDANKTAYSRYYESALQLVREGGLIAVDNTLWYGKVTQAADVADAATRAIQALNKMIHADTRVDMSLVPIGDGMTLARRRNGRL